MRQFQHPKKQADRELLLTGALAALTLLVMILLLVSPKEERGTFEPPPFERNAEQGVPDVPSGLGYHELFQDGMAYRFSICGDLSLDGTSAIVYFTNPASNKAWLKLRILDENGTVLGESGLLKPGEYLRAVSLSTSLAADSSLKLKIMGYEPHTYHSTGAVLLNVTTKGVSHDTLFVFPYSLLSVLRLQKKQAKSKRPPNL